MAFLGDYEFVTARLEALRAARGPSLTKRIATWGIPTEQVLVVLDRKYAETLQERVTKRVRDLLNQRDAPIFPQFIDAFLIWLSETPRFEEVAQVMKALDAFFMDKQQMKKWVSYASYHSGRSGDAEDAVHDVYLTIRRLRLDPRIEQLAVAWQSDPQTKPLLNEYLQNLFYVYLRHRCNDIIRDAGHLAELGPNLDPIVPPHEADPRYWLDRIVEARYAAGDLTFEEYRYYWWRRDNPEALEQDFDRTKTPVQVARIKASLVMKLARWWLGRGAFEGGLS